MTASECAHIGFLAEREVPPTPTVRHLDEIPELADAKLPVARTPIAPEDS